MIRRTKRKARRRMNSAQEYVIADCVIKQANEVKKSKIEAKRIKDCILKMNKADRYVCPWPESMRAES